jgi:hypothetical protein
MQQQFIQRAAVAALLAFSLLGQQPNKPTISKITAVPSEPIPKGTCTSSTAGYLEKAGRTNLTDAEIGKSVFGALRQGYIVTIYPPTKRGIFVNFECPEP